MPIALIVTNIADRDEVVDVIGIGRDDGNLVVSAGVQRVVGDDVICHNIACAKIVLDEVVGHAAAVIVRHDGGFGILEQNGGLRSNIQRKAGVRVCAISRRAVLGIVTGKPVVNNDDVFRGIPRSILLKGKARNALLNTGIIRVPDTYISIGSAIDVGASLEQHRIGEMKEGVVVEFDLLATRDNEVSRCARYGIVQTGIARRIGVRMIELNALDVGCASPNIERISVVSGALENGDITTRTDHRQTARGGVNFV